jgi:guanylate kinase
MCSNFDEPADEIGDNFPLDAYGISLAPPLTKELQARIDRSVNDAYADIKKNVSKNT